MPIDEHGCWKHPNLKLFEFSGAETDWVAAADENAARACLKSHYGISDEDVTGSYESIDEVEPSTVEFWTDEWDEEADEQVYITAADMMHGKTAPFVVGSTAH